MSEFQSVSTGVARIQQLSPNPQKLAGQCGKLKCCLNYEYEAYADAYKNFPDERTILKTKKGDAIYQKSDIFKGLMWYSYANDRANLMAIPIDKVKEIAAGNSKGVFPEALEDFAFMEERQMEFGGNNNMEGDLNRFD
jgi:cell fate regulator YaaT (PSP1 superfamily)